MQMLSIDITDRCNWGQQLFPLVDNTDALHLEIKNLENQLHRLQTRNQVLEGEVHTLMVQLEGREKALEEAQSEADLANRRLDNTDTVQRKQDRIDQLLAEVRGQTWRYKTDLCNLNGIPFNFI